MKTTVPAVSDLAAIRRLLSECALPSADLTPAHLPSFRILRRNETVVGVVGLELFDDVALLRSLAVSDACRGRGLGRRLADEAEALARCHRVRALYLLTTTAPAFFRERGYRAVERSAVPRAIRATREFSALCPADAICLARVLEPAGEWPSPP